MMSKFKQQEKVLWYGDKKNKQTNKKQRKFAQLVSMVSWHSVDLPRAVAG